MKKGFARLLAAAAVVLLPAALLLSACGGGSRIELSKDKINVVTSFYPLYDLTVKIGGGHVHVVNAVPSGVEPHDWAPKSMDISRMNKAELFVYQGAGFEGWVSELLQSRKPDSKVQLVEASTGLSLLAADHSGESHEGHQESEFDPHAWLSPQNAKKMAENIKNGLIQVDPANRADYEAGYKKLADQLDQLDQKFKTEIGRTPKKEIVVSHDAFAYLCRDYGLTQMPIMGLAPDAEPTPQDMKNINDFVKKNNVKYIFFEELVSDKLAKTLAADAGIETLVLNPLEGLTDSQLKAGEDYFSIMNANLQNLVKALQ